MTPETCNPALAAIAAMAAVTFLIRAGGFWLMGHVRLTPRVHRMLDSLPGSIVAAVVLPIAVQSGIGAVLAVTAAVAAMALWRNTLVGVVLGVTVTALARRAGI